MHIAAAALAVTNIGIPFAWAQVKLALASLFPVGKTVVELDELRLLPGAGDFTPLSRHLIYRFTAANANSNSNSPPSAACSVLMYCVRRSLLF